MKQRIFNGLLKKRLQKLMCFILVAACIIGTMNIPVLAAYTATTLDLTNGESISFTTSYSDYNYKISKTDLVNYIQNIPDENIKKNDLGIDKSTFDLSQIDDVRFDYKFNSLFTGISALNNLPDNAWYDKLNTYYDDYFVFRFDDYGSTNYYYDNAYFTTYNEATKSLCDVNFYTDENGKKILAFDLYWEYEEVELNTDKVLFTVDTFDNKNIKIKKSNFLALYNKYSDIQMDIDDISACSLHLYQNVGNPVGIRDVEAIIGDDEYFYFDLGYDYDYYGGNDPEDFKPARIVGMYSNINPVINNYPDGNGKYDINLHLTYVDETYAINDFMGQEINGILNLSHDAGKTIKGNKLTILETDNAEDFDYSFNSSYGENKNTKILIKHNGEVISTINPISTYDSNDFIHDGTKAYFGVIRLDGAACGEESVLLALPSTYEDYTYTGYDIEIETNEWGYDEKVFYLNFDVKTDHKYDEPTAKWTDDKCNFEFDCNYGDSNCTKTEVLPGQVSEKERKEPTCDQDGYIIYTAVCDTTNHEFENGIHECTTNHIHTSDSDPIVLPKTGHTAGEANRENEINPTCVDDGSYDLVTRCTKCNEIMSSEHKIVPALGHTWDDDDWTLVDSSEVTNELLANAENASSLKYEERCKVYKHYCTRYHDAYQLLIEPHKHTAGDAKRENEVNPTCVDDGSYDLVTRCTECNEIMNSKHVIVPALGHIWDDEDWTLLDSLEVTDELLQNAENASSLKYEDKCKVYRHYCTRYHDAYELLIVSHEHELGDCVIENKVDPTCTKDGGYDRVFYCKDCGEELQRDHIVLPKLGHEFGDWYVTKEPTYDEIGIKKHDCIRGDYSETSDIDKLTVQAVIKGTVKDSNGNLFKDATIELENGFKTTTDNNGYFEFKDVEAGTYTLKIKAENSASEFKITIQSPKSVVETTLETDCTTNYNVSNFDVEVNMLLNAKKQPEVIIEDKPKTEQIEKIEIEEIKTEKPVVEELKEIEELVEEKKEEKKEESTEKTEEKPVTDNKPQTGDDNSIYLFILLALLSGNWLVISYLLKKNKKY